MPSKYPHLVSLRGDESYARFLDQLAHALVKQRGVAVANHHQLAEHALAALGEQLGVAAPARMKPLGYNGRTAPAEPKPKTKTKPAG